MPARRRPGHRHRARRGWRHRRGRGESERARRIPWKIEGKVAAGRRPRAGFFDVAANSPARGSPGLPRAEQDKHVRRRRISRGIVALGLLVGAFVVPALSAAPASAATVATERITGDLTMADGVKLRYTVV